MEGFESFVGVNFWTALLTLCNMIITFLVLKKFLFKPVKKMIDDRQQEIDGLYADASHAKMPPARPRSGRRPLFMRPRRRQPAPWSAPTPK